MLWEKDASVAWQARHRLTATDYQTTFNQLVAQGYRPVCVSACNTGGDDLYAALWEQESGPAWVAHHAMSAGGYHLRRVARAGLSAALRHGLPG
jgi:hypothetical protein